MFPVLRPPTIPGRTKTRSAPRHGALWHACRDRLRIERLWSGFSSPLTLEVESITNLKFTFKNSRPPPAPPAAERVLTQGQRDALRVSKQFHAEHGFPPTWMEMAQRLGLRHQWSVDVRPRGLERAKAIETYSSVNRGLRILEQGIRRKDEDLPIMDEERFLRTVQGDDEGTHIQWLTVAVPVQDVVWVRDKIGRWLR